MVVCFWTFLYLWIFSIHKELTLWLDCNEQYWESGGTHRKRSERERQREKFRLTSRTWIWKGVFLCPVFKKDLSCQRDDWWGGPGLCCWILYQGNSSGRNQGLFTELWWRVSSKRPSGLKPDTFWYWSWYVSVCAEAKVVEEWSHMATHGVVWSFYYYCNYC